MSADKLDSLVKYTDRGGAVAILSQQKLRWSSPERFGDPFELSSTSELNFDTTSLLDSTIKLASSMIFAPEQPKGDSPLINAIRRWREEERFASADEAHPVLRELLSKMVDYRQVQLESNLSKWQAYVRNLRLCCFCSRPDNLVAWEQFAENHHGVALRFLPNESSGLLSAKPVLYQTERPQLTSLREQLGAILHNRKDTVVDRFRDHHFIKGGHRKQEQELRCHRQSPKEVPINDTQTDTWYDDFSFDRDQLTGIFFGLLTDADTRQQITTLATTRYPNAKLFQAVPSKVGYNVEFERVVVGDKGSGKAG